MGSLWKVCLIRALQSITVQAGKSGTHNVGRRARLHRRHPGVCAPVTPPHRTPSYRGASPQAVGNGSREVLVCGKGSAQVAAAAAAAQEKQQ
uniref:Putative secreted protein n=1 Tax=Anopheles triannulatus TaxID=58253 RepID=A0A2M4B464_9DIPT